MTNITDFGVASGNSAAQNDTAMGAAISALNAGQIKSLFIPAGNYQLGSTFTITRPGFGIWGEGCRASVLVARNNQDLFVIRSTNPSDPNPEIARLNDFSLFDFGVDYGSSPAGRRGTAFTLIRPGRAQIHNVDIRNVYRGYTIQGAVELFLSDITVGGVSEKSSQQEGSHLMKFSPFPGLPPGAGTNSEVFIVNFNLKSSGATGSMGDYGIIIESGDGIWFNNGHVGFVEKNDVLIDPAGGDSVQQIYFSNVYFDGNLTTTQDLSGAVRFGSSSSGSVSGVSFQNCTIKNHYSKSGIEVFGKNVSNLSVTNCQIGDNGREGIFVAGASTTYPATSLQVMGNYLFNNGRSNAKSNTISLSRVDMAIISNNIITSQKASTANGINVDSSCKNIVIEANIVKNYQKAVSNSATNSMVNTQLTAT